MDCFMCVFLRFMVLNLVGVLLGVRWITNRGDSCAENTTLMST